MKNYVFAVSTTFKDLLIKYGLDGITDLHIGEEAAEHNIFYKHLEAWDYNEGELEIYVED